MCVQKSTSTAQAGCARYALARGARAEALAVRRPSALPCTPPAPAPCCSPCCAPALAQLVSAQRAAGAAVTAGSDASMGHAVATRDCMPRWRVLQLLRMASMTHQEPTQSSRRCRSRCCCHCYSHVAMCAAVAARLLLPCGSHAAAVSMPYCWPQKGSRALACVCSAPPGAVSAYTCRTEPPRCWPEPDCHSSWFRPRPGQGCQPPHAAYRSLGVPASQVELPRSVPAAATMWHVARVLFCPAVSFAQPPPQPLDSVRRAQRPEPRHVRQGLLSQALLVPPLAPLQRC